MKVNNTVNINGKLFGIGRQKLEEKDGKIRGSIRVLTSDSSTNNVVEVRFMPQAPFWGQGETKRDNPNYALLKSIMENEQSVEKVGEQDALKLRITGDLTLNSYYRKEGNDYVLVETTDYRAKFAHDNTSGNAPDCATFDVDGLFLGLDDYLDNNGEPTSFKKVKIGVIDDYREVIMPMEFKLENPEGIALMETYVPQQTYIRILGSVVNEVTKIRTETQMDFGAPAVQEVTRYNRANLITSASTKSDVVISEEDLEKFTANRQKLLAEAKNRAVEAASKKDAAPVGFGAAPAANVNVAPASSSKKFDF